jgi:hypothetical protein
MRTAGAPNGRSGVRCSSSPLGTQLVRPSLRRLIRGVVGATVLAIVVSGNVAAADCTTHTRVCETLAIEASGPLRVNVQATSCIAGSGLGWDVTVTDGRRVVHVPVGDSPSLVPGREVKVPAAGRWRLEVRMFNADPDARCVRGESSTDAVRVQGVSSTPRATPRPTNAQPAPTPAPAVAPGASDAAEAPSASPSSSVAPPSAPGGVALLPPGPLPPPDGGDAAPSGPEGSREINPLVVLAIFVLGVGGIELIVFAIRRELKMRRRSASPE